MADKDEFKFDDDDTFPDTDLSGAFSEGEQAAPEEPEYPMTIKKSGGSKTRVLLLLLLLVIAGGAAYYFLMMEEPAPPPPPPRKAVAAAPKPAPVPAPAPVAPTQPAVAAGGQAQVAVPPPAPPAAAPAPAVATSVAVAPPPKPAATVAAPAPSPAPVPTKPVTAAVPLPKAEPKPAPAATSVPAPVPASKPAEAKPVVPAATGGPWMVEAGTFLNTSALKAVEKKIRTLGYEPQVSTTRKNVRMTRLRLGSFPESEVKEALSYVRGIAPDAFALRSGETFTVYAGTFVSPQNISQMTERLTSEGVKVEEEPLDVMRTISLVRFGGFADQATAGDVAAKARRAGIAAEVVKPH
jgi:cell division septation protein DedD